MFGVCFGSVSALRDNLLQALRLLKRNTRRGSASSLDSSSFAQIVNMCDLDDVSRYGAMIDLGLRVGGLRLVEQIV